MQIKARYSHLNGEEYLIVHRKQLMGRGSDRHSRSGCLLLSDQGLKGKDHAREMLFSPADMNQAFKGSFQAREWTERRSTFWVTADERLLRGIYG